MQLAVHELGGTPAAPPLVCLHGVTSHGRHFARLAERLGRSVLAPDLRGHGDSTWEPPWDLEQQLIDLKARSRRSRSTGSGTRGAARSRTRPRRAGATASSGSCCSTRRRGSGRTPRSSPPRTLVPSAPTRASTRRSRGATTRAASSAHRATSWRRSSEPTWSRARTACGGTGTRRAPSSPPTARWRGSRPHSRRCRRSSCSGRSRTSRTTS